MGMGKVFPSKKGMPKLTSTYPKYGNVSPLATLIAIKSSRLLNSGIGFNFFNTGSEMVEIIEPLSKRAEQRNPFTVTSLSLAEPISLLNKLLSKGLLLLSSRSLICPALETPKCLKVGLYYFL